MKGNKQTIQGGNLLQSIANMLFKGIDKIIGEAAEYEEEMGVLKQVTRIPIYPDGDNTKEYTLTIKLAPVRGKDGLYYVEAKTDAPDFDVSSLNGKTIRLNNTNMKDFNKKIDELLDANDLSVKEKPEEDSDSSSEESEDTQEEEDQQESDTNSEQSNDELAQSDYDIDLEPLWVDDEKGQPLVLNRNAVNKPKEGVCSVTFTVFDVTNNEVKKYKSETADIPTKDKKGNNLSFAAFKKEIDKLTDEYMKKYKLVKNIRSSTSIDATFVKSSTNQVSLVAIKASSDVKDVMNIICDVVDDDEFVDSLISDEETSFRISDNGESYEIERIDSVDTSGTYDTLFGQAIQIRNTLESLKWALGPNYNYSGDFGTLESFNWPLSSLVDYFASLVVRHTDHYPACIGCAEYPTFEEFKDESGKLSKDMIIPEIKLRFEDFLSLIDTYYVNLEPEEQTRINPEIDSIKNTLAYLS